MEIEEYHKVHFSFLHFFCSDGRQTGDASVWSTKTEHLGASRFSSDGLQKTCCHCTCNLLQHELLFLLIKKTTNVNVFCFMIRIHWFCKGQNLTSHYIRTKGALIEL